MPSVRLRDVASPRLDNAAEEPAVQPYDGDEPVKPSKPPPDERKVPTEPTKAPPPDDWKLPVPSPPPDSW